MALSKTDLEAIDALIESRQPTSPIPHETKVVKADVNIGDMLTKIATAGLVAGMGWLITSVSDMKTQQALIIQEQVNQKAAVETVSRTVQEGTRDRYPRQEALNDHAEILERLVEFRAKQAEGFSRIEKIEQQLAIMEATTK